MDWKTKRILKLERLLKECEKELEDAELRQKITEILIRKQ